VLQLCDLMRAPLQEAAVRPHIQSLAHAAPHGPPPHAKRLGGLTPSTTSVLPHAKRLGGLTPSTTSVPPHAKRLGGPTLSTTSVSPRLSLATRSWPSE
jgi:hypothetical protein